VPAREHIVRLLRFASFTALQNVTGSPAISLPLARTEDGLPIGVQVAAPLGEERRLLSLAYELEATMPWPHTPGAIKAMA
jgi:amidase